MFTQACLCLTNVTRNKITWSGSHVWICWWNSVSLTGFCVKTSKIYWQRTFVRISNNKVRKLIKRYWIHFHQTTPTKLFKIRTDRNRRYKTETVVNASSLVSQQPGFWLYYIFLKSRDKTHLFNLNISIFFVFDFMKTFVVALIGSVSMRRFQWVPTTYVFMKK